MGNEQNRLTVVEVDPIRGSIVRKLFTGECHECRDVLDMLLELGWPVCRVALAQGTGEPGSLLLPKEDVS